MAHDLAMKPTLPRFATTVLCGLFAVTAICVLVLTRQGNEADGEFVALSSISMPEQVSAGTIVSIEVASPVDAGNSEVIVHNGFGRLRFTCLLYTSPSPRDQRGSRMPSSA